MSISVDDNLLHLFDNDHSVAAEPATTVQMHPVVKPVKKKSSRKEEKEITALINEFDFDLPIPMPNTSLLLLFFEKLSIQREKQEKLQQSKQKLKSVLEKKGISAEILLKKPALSLMENNEKVSFNSKSIYIPKEKPSIERLNELLSQKQRDQLKIMKAKKREKDEKQLQKTTIHNGRIFDSDNEDGTEESVPVIECNTLVEANSGEPNLDGENREEVSNFDSIEQNSISSEVSDCDVSLDELSDSDDILNNSKLLDLISQKFSTPSDKIQQTPREITEFFDNEAEVEDEFGNLIEDKDGDDTLNEVELEQEMIQSKFIEQRQVPIDAGKLAEIHNAIQSEKDEKDLNVIYQKVSHSKRSLEFDTMIQKYGESLEQGGDDDFINPSELSLKESFDLEIDEMQSSSIANEPIKIDTENENFKISFDVDFSTATSTLLRKKNQFFIAKNESFVLNLKNESHENKKCRTFQVVNKDKL